MPAPVLTHELVRHSGSTISMNPSAVSVKVDFILSDWMGDCLFSRSRLLTLLHARDRYLAHSGLILPDKVALYLGAVTAPYDVLDFWKEDVRGFDMRSAKPLAVQGRTSAAI